MLALPIVHVSAFWGLGIAIVGGVVSLKQGFLILRIVTEELAILQLFP